MDIAVATAVYTAASASGAGEAVDFEQFAPGAPQGLTLAEYHASLTAFDWRFDVCFDGFGCRKLRPSMPTNKTIRGPFC
jgi:hypothetical protein